MRRLVSIGIVTLGVAAALAAVWGGSELQRRSAWRLVGAPNYGQSPEPEPLHPAVSRALRVEVGPPKAELDVWILEPETKAAGTVLVLHGVYDRKRTMVGFGMMLRDRNRLRTVLVDLRGHGHSSGNFLSFGPTEARDLIHLLDTLAEEELLTPPVSIYGPSYGAAVALHTAAADPRVEAVVTVATFGRLEDIIVPYIDHFHPQIAWALPGAWSQEVVDRANAIANVDLRASDNLEAISSTSARVLIMHGAADEIVAVDQAHALHEACGSERCKLVVFPGEDHGESMSGKTLNQETLQWLAAQDE